MEFKSQKDKLSFLANLKSTPINLNDITTLLTISKSSFTKSILTALFDSLSQLDTKISVLHEYTPQSEWSSITSAYDTPTDDNSETRERIRTFTSAFLELRATVNSYDAAIVFDLLGKYIIVGKTQHMQFLIFDMLDSDVKSINYIIMHVNDRVVGCLYLVYLIGLLVRYPFENCVFKKIVALLKDGQWYGKSALVVLQGFMYLCCFKREIFDELGGFICERRGSWNLLNKKIVDVYCGLFGVENVECFVGCVEVLNYFPFDPPCLDVIFDKYNEKFLKFKKD